MGMSVICPDCGHSERSSTRRGARIGPCPECGTQMRAHTAGKAKGRYICPIAGGVHTHGLGNTAQLTEPMRLVFVPGWDDDRYEPDPDRPGWNRRVTYHRDTPRSSEQDRLDRAAGRVFGPGCVISGGYQQPAPGDQWHGRAGVYLVPAPDADPATWFVNEPVTYKKCAACPTRVVASDKTRMDHEWVPARESGWWMRRAEISPGPHPAGTYTCPDCRPPATSPAPQYEQATGQTSSTPTAPQEGSARRKPAPAAQPETGGPVTAAEGQGQGRGHAAIHAAVARLAGVCDFAESLDGQGFNATDTWLGHVLAAMPASAWTEDEALAAWDMLRKYRGQLDGFGIGYDELPRPHGADELETAQREEARDRARQRGRQWREQQYHKAHSYVRCDGAGEKVTLAFPYDPAIVDQAKAIKGRYFDWDTKTNVYPFTTLPQVVAFAEAHGIDVAPEVRALVPAATAQAQQEATRPNVYTDQAGQVVISAEYDPRLNEALKNLNGGRSTWDPRARVHRPPVHRDPSGVLAVAEQFGLSVGDDARTAIEAEKARQERNQAAATAFEADPVPVPGLAAGTALKPQQYPVVRFATEHRRVLIGDDMGWGKTLSSLAAVAADGAYPAVVVCRPSLTLNWAAEIRRFFPALTVHEAVSTTPQPVSDGTDVIVIGSAALAAKPRTTKAGGKEFGWVKALAAAAPKALIIDEGQDTKERAANRSQACEQLAGAVIARDGLVLDLTGTAILNRPRELCQQLTILGRIGEFGGPKAFLWRYCLSEVNEWGASYNGARNLIELHDRLLAWGIMIRRADDAKLGLPPCREHALRIPHAQLDPAVMARYRQAEQDLLGYLADRARQAAERLGTDPAHAAVQAAIRAQAAEHLVAINTLRQLAGHAKRAYVTAWVGERVAAGEKVMVAAHHRGEVDHYASQFGGLKLQGGQPVADKEAAKAAFQQLPADKAPVIAVAIAAGGVGHTLTAAAIGIQAEQAWTPGETQQMKKRLHRIGQDRPVDYYITVAENTIDQHFWEVVTAKQATLNAVLDGKSDEGTADDENSVIAEVAWRLTQQGLGSDPQPSRPVAEGSPCPAGCMRDWPNHREPERLRANVDGELSCPKCWGVFGIITPDHAASASAGPAADVDKQEAPSEEPGWDAQPGGPDLPPVRVQEIADSAVCWVWHGTTDFVTHEIRTELPHGATWWIIWADEEASRPGLVFSHAKREEAERNMERLRASEADKLAANRFLRSLGYTATEHAATRNDCNCNDCQPPPASPAANAQASTGADEASRQAEGGAGRATDQHQGGQARDTVAGEPGPGGGDSCPGCGTARLFPGRTVCQACGVLVAMGRLHLPGVPGSASGQAATAASGSPADNATATAPAQMRVPAAPVNAQWTRTCARCHAKPPGPGGILCQPCSAAIEARNRHQHLSAATQDTGNQPVMTPPTALTLADGQMRPVTKTWPDGSYACPWCESPAGTPGEARAEWDRGCANPACRVNMSAEQLAASRQREADEAARWQQAESIRRFNMRMAEEREQSEAELWDSLAAEAQERGACLTCLRTSRWRSGRDQAKFVRHRTASYHANHDAADGGNDASQPGPPTGHDRAASAPAASEDDDGDAPPIPGRPPVGELRRLARHYLAHGLQPVPAWAAKANGECCCRRGADCPRPGKHPRSVHVGPGEHDYSWKRLACRTPEEVDQRFADGGRYAEANLMLAIPAGMLVIDQDDDDGGHQAIAELAEQHGELPPTLAHPTPHGVHRIYRTPPGWTGRAWVGKDARNPLPAGIDLRVPGQILMAPPSRVSAPEGMVSYGPPAGAGVADLPAAYVTAWTPPQSQAARPRRTVPVPPERYDAAASYVHAKVTGITADVAACKPGGRNTALYTAALKVGSALGAARATPGAEHAAADWTDQVAEDALMDAAEANGYVAKHGAAAARTAIRSGLRNGLRNPRPLPDFTAPPTTQPPAGSNAHPRRKPGGTARATAHTRAASAAQAQDVSAHPGQAWPPDQALRPEAPTARSASAVLRSAGFVASSEALKAVHVAEGYQVQATPQGGILVRHVAINEPVNGVSPPARKEQMLAGYAYALQAAGFHAISQTKDSLMVQSEATHPAREPASQADSTQTQASRTAGAVNKVNRTRQIGRARAVPQARGPAAAGNDRQAHRPVRERARDPSAGQQTGQRWPGNSAHAPEHQASGPGRPTAPARHQPDASHTSPRTASDPAPPSMPHCGSQPPAPAATEAADWRDAVIESERQQWQPKVVQPDGPGLPTPEAEEPEASA
jgi:Bifunctional DNA primase/polymerase, N-terminal/SNF2-related domain